MSFTRTRAGGVWGTTQQLASVKKAAEASAAKRRKNHPAPPPRRYSAAEVPSGSRMNTPPMSLAGKPGPRLGVGGARLGVPEGKVRSSDYGMHYDPANEKVVEHARTQGDDVWDKLPVTSLPAGTPLEANEELLKRKPIDKIVSGAEPFRAGYVTKLVRAPDGKLHVADGHHRVAMYHALKKDMPVRIMDAAKPPTASEAKILATVAAKGGRHHWFSLSEAAPTLKAIRSLAGRGVLTIVSEGSDVANRTNIQVKKQGR